MTTAFDPIQANFESCLEFTYIKGQQHTGFTITPEMIATTKEIESFCRNASFLKLLILYFMDEYKKITGHTFESDIDQYMAVDQYSVNLREMIQRLSQDSTVKPKKLYQIHQSHLNTVDKLIYKSYALLDLFLLDQHITIHLNPYLVVYLETLLNHKRLFNLGSSNSKQEVIANKLLFLVELLINVSRPELKKIHLGMTRKKNKNFCSLKSYVNYLFKRYSKLLVLRVDFSYLKEEQVNSEEMICHREQLLKQILAKDFVYEVIGYIWKLERGLAKGLHYHMVFFINGSKHVKDIYIARQIGECWQNVTRQKGIYFNCNSKKFEYKNCGIGLISHDNQLGRENLDKAIYYLAKTDFYSGLDVLEGKSLGRGKQIKARDSPSKMGRPRFKQPFRKVS